MTVTQQYPENRDELRFPERFRGMVVMPHDQEGEHKCTGCTLCFRNCPYGAITGEKKKVHVIDQEKCKRCNICYEVCKFDAVKVD